MSIVGFFDVHRSQVTFEYEDSVSGEVVGGQIRPACREELGRFLQRFAGRDDQVVFGVEGCTGWWFVHQELEAAGIATHVADPAELVALRSRKKRAKTDRADARHGRQMLGSGRLPESWVPPEPVIHARALGRLYLDLVQDRNAWFQRVHATLFHWGAPPLPRDLCTPAARARAEVAAAHLPAPQRRAVVTALQLADGLTERIVPLRQELVTMCRDQPAARMLHETIFGIGPLLGTVIWAELGDCRRFTSSSQAVRHTGLDVTVHSSDRHRSPGHLARQGPPGLRWALYEAAKCQARPQAPLHGYYRSVAERRDNSRATLSTARKLARICYHRLVAAGDLVLQAPTPAPPLRHRRRAV